jgi:hypothetical protein
MRKKMQKSTNPVTGSDTGGKAKIRETEKKIKEIFNVEKRTIELERHIGEIEDYNCKINIREKYNAFKSKKDAFLFICIIKTNDPQRPKDPIKIKIFFFENQNSYLHILEKEDAKQLRERWKVLKDELKHQNLEKIKKCGSFFYEKLLGNQSILRINLFNEHNGMGGIWIFCKVADIDPTWEWLCTKNSNGEDFFWGDEFHIVRIQEDCDMSECLVNKKIFILANMDVDEEVFVNPLQSNLLDAGLSNYVVIRSPADNTNLDCCIILYAAGNDNIIRGNYESKLRGFFMQKNKILFFNLYPPGPLKLDKLPVAWIDSPFDNITEDFTLTFVNCFFKAYKNLLEKRTKVRVTEIVAKTREMMESKNILWRLGCVVNGNPNIMLTA